MLGEISQTQKVNGNVLLQYAEIRGEKGKEIWGDLREISRKKRLGSGKREKVLGSVNGHTVILCARTNM